MRFTEREGNAILAILIAGVPMSENTLRIAGGISEGRAMQIMDYLDELNTEEIEWLMKRTEETRR